MERRVQFSELAPDVVGVRTWPRGALKPYSQPPSLPPASTPRRRKQKAKSLVVDIYRGYRTLEDVDNSELLHVLVKDQGDNALMSWTVLNMVLRSAESRLQFHLSSDTGTPEPAPAVALDAKASVQLLGRATAHFDVFSQSTDVLDNRVLSQIMRTVELIWVHATRESYASETAEGIDAFVERCIGLIRAKPSSKSLTTTALRVINLINWSFIDKSRISSLINALSKTQLAFATSFAAESVIAYTNASQLYPDIMDQNQEEWAPVALKALFSNSPVTRNQSLVLLQGCTASDVLFDALSRPADSSPSPDALARIVARRMLAMVQVANFDDVKLMMQVWCLIVQAAGEVDKKWQHLDIWLDVARSAFKLNMEAALTQWDAFLAISNLFNRPDLLAYPLNSGVELTVIQFSTIIDSALQVYHISENLWDSFLEDVFKTLGQSKQEQFTRLALEKMESILRPVRLWLGSNISRVLNACMVVFRNPVSSPQLSAKVWQLLAEAAQARSQAMELLRFHYKFLSLDLPLAPSLTSILMEAWSLKTLTDKAKASSHSLLSLTLLPITSFGTTTHRVAYIEKNILGKFHVLGEVLIVLRTLLATVTNNESQQSSQLDRWITAATVLLDFVGKNRDNGSQGIMKEAASMFLSLFSSEGSSSGWNVWAQLMSEIEAADEVLSKLHSVESSDGLNAILSLRLSGSAISRIVVNSMNESTIALVKKASKQGIVTTEFIDEIAKVLVTQNHHRSAELALDLLTSARAFVLTKPFLQAITETRSTSLVDLWNSRIVPNVTDYPPFLSREQAAKYGREIPSLKISSNLVQGSGTKRPPMTPLASDGKRPKRRVLTGSVPPSLSTPPPSDSLDDNLPSSADELFSSPPRSVTTALPSWKNAQERARVLKRVMMGLNMQDAMQGMKRSECEMIYNLLFRACVDLQTHLSVTAIAKSESEISEARDQLQQVLEQREKQEAREVEEARLRRIKREAEALEGEADDDDEMSDFIEDEEDDQDDESYSIKREPRGSPVFPAAQRSLRART